MRIPCPYCGSRDLSEFAILGDASPRMPERDGVEGFADSVYLRDNPAGPHKEFWYHAQGCRSWLVLERNTLTHEILAARLAGGRLA